jgi:deoxycytidine triphosphate deaminase
MFIGEQGISAAMRAGRIHFTGARRGDGLLLCAGSCLLPFRNSGAIVDPDSSVSTEGMYRTLRESWDTYVLSPKELILIQTQEKIELADSLLGIIGTLSHIARLGIMAHLTSPFINPGFSGHITLEVFNASPSAIRLSEGMPLAKVMISPFSKGRRNPKRSFYGEHGKLATKYSEDPDVDNDHDL